MAGTQMKFLVALALIGALALATTVRAQDYDDEGGRESNDGYGGFSGGGGDDDYAAPRERGVVGAEGSEAQPGYHQQGEESGNDNYDADDSAAAASHVKPTIARANLVKLIQKSARK